MRGCKEIFAAFHQLMSRDFQKKKKLTMIPKDCRGDSVKGNVAKVVSRVKSTTSSNMTPNRGQTFISHRLTEFIPLPPLRDFSFNAPSSAFRLCQHGGIKLGHASQPGARRHGPARNCRRVFDVGSGSALSPGQEAPAHARRTGGFFTSTRDDDQGGRQCLVEAAVGSDQGGSS